MSARILIRAGWAVLTALVLAAAMYIPVFSGQDPAKGQVGHPRLFPFYYQTNQDAPMELATALGFPGIYRTIPDRINRPTEYAILAGISLAIKPVVDLVLPGDGREAMWGRWPARDYLTTYAIWVALNLALILAALVLYHRMAARHFDPLRARLASIMMLTSPIVLLSLRESHNGAYHIFAGMATFAFWHAVLLDDMPLKKMVPAALGIGLLYLGKPCINGFGTGLLLCLWLGQARKLAIILPAAALPTLLWMGAVKTMGLQYTVSDVTAFGAGVWIFRMDAAGLAREAGLFLATWFRTLGENVYLPLVAFAGLGAWSLWRSGRRMILGVFALSIAVDMAFYFLLHRMHAVYGMNSLAPFFVTAAEGLVYAIAGGARAGSRLSAPVRAVLCVLVVLALQLALNFRQLPRYGG